MSKAEEILHMICESTSYKIGDIINKTANIVDTKSVDLKHDFIIIQRSPMKVKDQDNFYMVIIDKKSMKVIVNIGTHPSKKGASIGFYDNSVKGKTIDQLKKDFPQ